jgi:DNA-binding MarR family transcriptional regulator
MGSKKKTASSDDGSGDRAPCDLGLLGNSLSFLIYRAHRATAHAWVARWGEDGIRYGYYNAFVLIGGNPGILVVELAECLGIDKSRASELIDAMEKDDLVSRRRLASDHRSFGIYLTPDATVKLAALIDDVAEYEHRSIDSLFTDEERRSLIGLISRVAALP